MPQSLSKLLVHIIFSTKNREPWLTDALRPRVFAYLAKTGRDQGCEIYRVGGVGDHVHLAVLLPRTLTVADLLKVLKQSSSAWIKEHGDNHQAFSWQAGYGAFTLGISQLPTLLRYIDNQEEHHRKRSFRDEFREFLTRYEIEFDERYVWD